MEKKNKPCPFCGGTDLQFRHKMSHGHGDSGFDCARIQCRTCSGSKGDGWGYGSPDKNYEDRIWAKWNEDRIK